MPELPSGTVTFLFTDIEGSTQRWERRPEIMTDALARHDVIVRQAVETNGGRVFKTVGDAVCAAFPTAIEAVIAAVDAQLALGAEAWGELGGLRVRMAIHSGATDERDGDYFGPPLNRVARLLAAGHGDQILLSRATHELVRDGLPSDLALRDLGEHRLKDLQQSERIFQVLAPGLASEFPPPRTLDTLLHNLPTHPTPLIGRAQEAVAARDLLQSSDVRLVTLTGPGGAGKTRLSLHLAAVTAAEFADGVFFVSLAAIVDPDLVLPAIAAAIGVRDTGGQPLDELVREDLRGRHLLLVLDNFEQVTAAAPVVAQLLADCPRLKLLVTSRACLHLRGEHELPVPPLALPDLDASGAEEASPPAPLDQIAQSEAVQLFVKRAQAVKADFAVTPENAVAVVEICRRLDALPLGIELAAARIRLLPPQAMLRRLDRRLDLLTGGARDLPARQQTMRGAIAWSYDLLDPDEQRLFARLAIFVRGCTLEAAEEIGGKDLPASLDLLDSLADKSLIRLLDDAEEAPRLGMLETIREFAQHCLTASDEAGAIGRRHADWFLALAEEAEPHLEGPEQARWLDRLDQDHANLRAALGWLRERGETDLALRLGGALWRFWCLRGHFTEGRAQLDELLLLPTDAQSAARAKALNGAGVLADGQGDYDRAAALHVESLAVVEALGDKRAIAWSLNNLGWVAMRQGDYDRAQSLLERNLAIAQETSDTLAIATATTDLGNVAYYHGDVDRAKAAYEAGLHLFRDLGDDAQIAASLNNLAAIALDQQDIDGAGTLLSEALTLRQAVGDKPGIGQTLNNLAEVARRQGDDDRATTLYEESRVLAQETGDKLGTAISLDNLADLARRRGDPARAQTLYTAAFALYRTVGDWLGICACLVGFANLAAASERMASAVRLLAVRTALRATHSLPDTGPEADELMAPLRQTMGEDAFALAWDEGQDMALEQVIAETLAPDRSPVRVLPGR